MLVLGVLAGDQLAVGYRILGVFPLPGKSHFVMMEQILLRLARMGHQVDVYNHFPQKEPVPNYTDISLVGTSESVVNNMTAKDVKKFGSLSMSVFAQTAGDKVCSLLGTEQLQGLIKNPPKDPPYDVIILELFLADCYFALGKHLNAPVVAIAASSILDWQNEQLGNPMNTALVPSIFSGFNHQVMTFWERMKNTLLSNIITAQLEYYRKGQTVYVEEHMGIKLDSIYDVFNEVALVLVNTHHSLHHIRPNTNAVIEVGGVHVTEDDIKPLPADVQKFLDDAKHGCVFFTFGSMVRIETLPDDIVKDLYKTFENIAPVRVLMKIAKPEELIPGLPKNVMIKPWFAQKAILKHKNTKVFLTHGGLMGTWEAVHFAVPLVGIPLFGDQDVNIRNCVRKNVAITLGSINNVTAETLTRSLKTVLYDKSYAENSKALAKLFKDRPISAMDTSTYWIEYVARHGKILQSPAIQLNWFQRRLIDVYGVLIACVLAVLYVIYMVLRRAVRWVCPCRPKASASKKNK